MRRSGKVDLALKAAFCAAMAGTTVWSFFVPDAPAFQYPATARIFFWHFPCPMMLTVFMAMGCYFSLRYFVRVRPILGGRSAGSASNGWVGGQMGAYPRTLPEKNPPLFSSESDAREREVWDLRAVASFEIGLIFAVCTLVSGMLFSLVAWGAIWQGDWRQQSFLLALLIYAAYFALRSAFRDPEKRAENSAAYMLAACLPLLFLIYIFPRLPQIKGSSFHPTDTILKGNLTGAYWEVTLVLLVLLSILTTWIYRMRIKLGLLLLEKQNGTLEARRGLAGPAVVVRPVRLSHEDRSLG